MPDERAQGGVTITQVTEVLRQADRLGLTWGRRPGTVVFTTGLFTPRQASVVMDGDSVGITVVSLVGDLVVGDRIMVDRVPPAGLYAIARISGPPSPFALALTSDSATITAETVMHTFTDLDLRFGYAYRVEGGNRIDAPGSATAIFRLRRTNIAGAIVAQSPTFPGVGTGLSASAHWTSFIAPTLDIVDTFVYTLTGTGPGVISDGSAVSPRFVSVTLAGPVDGFPQAVPVS
jgi:hypothetical protein